MIYERPQLIDSVAKRLRMRQNLSSIQNKLKPAEKSFSKLIHQPLIQRISELASRTIARPSGILGGGLAAFIGGLGYQLVVRSSGLPYDFGVVLVCFIVGFVLGLLGELLVRGARR